MNDELVRILSQVELLVLDIDGVLTDGKLLYGDNGEIGKQFNVKDGFGMRRLLNHGVAIAAISGRKSQGASRRLSELGLVHIYLGCKDKTAQINKLQKALAIGTKATAVIGDDVPDLDMMSQSACAIAVADASEEIKSQVNWITSKNGGCGAVREVCDAILAAKAKFL